MDKYFRYFDIDFTIDTTKCYSFPCELKYVKYKGFLLIISPSNGNWIVLENDVQYNIFCKLRIGSTVLEVMQAFYYYDNDVNYVIAQMEGKHFSENFVIEQENEFALRIYLTNACNLRCRHCLVFAGNELENELSCDEICQFISESKNNGCRKVIFTGGEVLQKDGFTDILKHSKELDLYVQVLTNGTLWTRDLVKETHSYIDEIQISIDGFDEASNAKVRGKGAFEKSLFAVDEFLKYDDVSVYVIVTPMYDMLTNNYDAFVNFGRKLSNKYEDKDFAIIFTRELLDGREISVSKEINKKYNELTKKLADNIYPNIELTAFVRNHKYNRILSNCGYGGITLNSNGDVYFCCRVVNVKKYGNIRNTPHDEIFRLRKIARAFSQVDMLEPCRNCDLKFICGGDCRISNFNQITKVKDFDAIDFASIAPRICDDRRKEELYHLMIEANDYLLWQYGR